MHIAVVLLNRGRGSGAVARQHVRTLLRNGADVTLLYAGMDDGVPGAINVNVELSSDVFPVHEYLPGQSHQRVVADMEAGEAFACVADFERTLRGLDRPVDVILAHHANVTAVAAHRVARSWGIPFALFLHGTGIEPRHAGGYDDALWAAIEQAIGAASGVLVTTEYVRDRLIRPLVDIPLDRFLVMPCGVDITEFSPGEGAELRAEYGLPDRYVICPGALIQSKGPQNVVWASELYSDLAPTIFLGDGELREDLEVELDGRGRFLGYVPNEVKAALINGATVLTAAPEKLEHFGIIYVEALAAGAVPVAYRGGGVDTIVTDDVGVLTERSTDELGRAIRAVLEHPQRGAQLAAAGRKRAIAGFDEVALGKQLTSWLEKMARGHAITE